MPLDLSSRSCLEGYCSGDPGSHFNPKLMRGIQTIQSKIQSQSLFSSTVWQALIETHDTIAKIRLPTNGPYCHLGGVATRDPVVSSSGEVLGLIGVHTSNISCMNEQQLFASEWATFFAWLSNFSCLNDQFFLPERSTFLVWTSNFSCLNKQLFLSERATFHVWTSNFSCLNEQLFLSEWATFLVWISNFSCLNEQLFLSERATFLVRTSNFFCLIKQFFLPERAIFLACTINFSCLNEQLFLSH